MDSDEGPGLTFRMDEFDEKPAGNADKQGGRSKGHNGAGGAIEIPDDDQMLGDDY